MLQTDFKGIQLSRLGFGTMRLPLLEDGTIDVAQTREMTRYAIEHGINYFDTAYPYHNGFSERVVGEILKEFPRESWYLADKYPGHQHVARFTPKETFEQQLAKCGVDYFDFYLMHNVCENSLPTYMNTEWGILDYFVEQKRLGRIRHLGFSSHAEVETLRDFLDSPYGEHMEFCQIQLNYVDWTLQRAREKCSLLAERGIPVWVMEPLRGGLLAKQTDPSLAFRWLLEVPGVKVILSGMSDFNQMKANIATFENPAPLSEAERAQLEEISVRLQNRVPCTGCRYCTGECPQSLDIPLFINAYNDMAMQVNFTPLMRIEALEEGLRPSACLGCGACAQMCPQGIDIPGVIARLNDLLAGTTSWADICRHREIVQRDAEVKI
jgi:Predicted oxidoreductases of the aldo/keto reductase family